MRLTLSFIISIVLAVALVAFGFAFYQSSTEKTTLVGELKIRASQVSEEIYQNNRNYFKRQKKIVISKTHCHKKVKSRNQIIDCDFF